MRLLEKLNRLAVVLVVLVLFLALDGFLFYHYQQTLQVTESAAPIQLNPEAKPAAARHPSASSREEAEELRLVASVVDVPTGLSIYEDGQLVLDQVSEPGFRQEFEAEEITISTNNAGASWIEANGRDLGALGASGEPVTRTFTAESVSE